MTKKRPRRQLYQDYADAFKCIREGRKVKRSIAKDGSIPTHPIIFIPDDYPEHVVLAACMAWLHKHHIFCNRNNAGVLPDASGIHHYGIVGAGDIIGLLPTGQHFEIEVKRGKGGRLSEGQQKRMKNIRENNGVYLVCHGVEELEYYFKDLI